MRVHPINTGYILSPLELMARTGSGWKALAEHPLAEGGMAQAPRAGVPDRASGRRQDPGRHGPARVGRHRPEAEHGRPDRALLHLRDGARAGRRGTASRARHRGARHRRRRDDPPAHGPRVRDLRLHRGDLRARRGRVGGVQRAPRDLQRLHPEAGRARGRLPRGRLRHEARAAPTRPSAARSTSSATARSGSSTRRATRPGTSR